MLQPYYTSYSEVQPIVRACTTRVLLASRKPWTEVWNAWRRGCANIHVGCLWHCSARSLDTLTMQCILYQEPMSNYWCWRKSYWWQASLCGRFERLLRVAKGRLRDGYRKWYRKYKHLRMSHMRHTVWYLNNVGVVSTTKFRSWCGSCHVLTLVFLCLHAPHAVEIFFGFWLEWDEFIWRSAEGGRGTRGLSNDIGGARTSRAFGGATRREQRGTCVDFTFYNQLRMHDSRTGCGDLSFERLELAFFCRFSLSQMDVVVWCLPYIDPTNRVGWAIVDTTLV